MASVSLQRVSKSYGGIRAVDDVTLDIREGEFVVLLGPSGCGKTTILRVIAGFTRPSEGRVLIGGQDVTTLPPRLRNIGMVFQNYALFPNMTVAENIAFGLRERKVDKATISRRVAELLDLVRLPGMGNRHVDELSGGQQQRVALARALAFSPRVLLMDEPLGALDLKLRESMQIELHKIQRDLGITTVFVTHDQQEAMSLSDRIVIMNNGRIQQVGGPEELYATPGNRFVADFIGKTNVIRGHVADAGAWRCAVRVGDGLVVTIPGGAAYAVGDGLDISVRPEQLVLSASWPSSGFNAIPGTVERRRFLGNIVHYFVRVPWGQVLLVERPASAEHARVGEQVHVVWRPESAVAFRTDGEGALLADAGGR